MPRDFNDAKKTAEGLNMDQQLMADFLESGVLGLSDFQLDAAIQSLTNMPVSTGGDFATNLNYVMDALMAKDEHGDAMLMTDQEAQDLALMMTDNALGRNALCVAVLPLQSIKFNQRVSPADWTLKICMTHINQKDGHGEIFTRPLAIVSLLKPICNPFSYLLILRVHLLVLIRPSMQPSGLRKLSKPT